MDSDRYHLPSGMNHQNQSDGYEGLQGSSKAPKRGCSVQNANPNARIKPAKTLSSIPSRGRRVGTAAGAIKIPYGNIANSIAMPNCTCAISVRRSERESG